MSADHLSQMGLDLERVRTAVDFLDSYATLALSEIDHDDADEPWAAITDAASALREAGQWAVCYDPQRARDLLDRSGEAFDALGYPFGSFLRAVAGKPYEEPAFDLLRDRLQRLVQPAETPATGPDRTPLLHPQQQAYLVVAAAASPLVAGELRAMLQTLIYESPHRMGVVPVGALGTPIRRFWRVAADLLEPSPETAWDFSGHVSALARSYAESMELASANNYCWRHAAAPVDVGDIDIVGLVTLASRRFRGEDMAGMLFERAGDGPPEARAILEIALEYASF